jgi:para-nitrobenzyl esterase
VYIHGGGFAANSAALYPGDQLAQDSKAVVVVINYRLSYQGFVVFTPLLEENDGVVNYGLTDQQLALEWVQDNIEEFGGDKKNVLIFGNSAGGMSVLMHYTFPSSEKLFKVGIAESAGPWDYITAANAARNNDPRAARFGCYNNATATVNITCLRAVPIKDFYTVGWSGSQPVVDKLFTGSVAVSFSKKSTMEKAGRKENPIIIGHALYEGNQFAYLALRIVKNVSVPTLDCNFTQFVGILYNSLPFTTNVTNGIAQYYSSFKNGTNFYVPLREALGDFGIKCGNIRTALNGVKGLDKNVYNYYFTHNTESWRFTRLNATHTVEIPYLFRTNGTIFETKFTTAEKKLSDRLAKFSDNLQNIGRPTKNEKKWPALKKSGEESTYTWDLKSEKIDIDIPASCEVYWNAVVDNVVTRSSQAASTDYNKFKHQTGADRELGSMFGYA